MAKKSAEIRFEAEQKRYRTIIIAIILLLLGLVLIIAGTYAYYQKTITGTVTGTIATWNFKANSSTSSFRVTLTPSGNKTANSTIAPGTSGSFSVVLSAASSALPVNYVLTFGSFTNIPTNLVFYSDSSHTTVADIEASGYSVSGSLAAGGSVTKTWYWVWPYGSSSSVAADNADANKTVSFNVNVVGTQKNQ